MEAPTPDPSPACGGGENNLKWGHDPHNPISGIITSLPCLFAAQQAGKGAEGPCLAERQAMVTFFSQPKV